METEQEQVRQALGALLQYAQQAVEFSKEQAPLLAQEIVRWGVVSNAVEIALSGALIFCAFRYCKRLCDAARAAEDFSFREASSSILAVVLACAGGVSFFVAVDAVLAMTKAIFAPRLYLIEYLGRVLS